MAELLKLDITQPAHSKFNSPIFAIWKKNRGIRLVLNFRAINANMHTEKYSMKDICNCISDSGRSGSTIFITINLTARFWQLLLYPLARPYTTFTIPGQGQYQWITMPMGLFGAPASFQWLMGTIVYGLPTSMTFCSTSQPPLCIWSNWIHSSTD